MAEPGDLPFSELAHARPHQVDDLAKISRATTFEVGDNFLVAQGLAGFAAERFLQAADFIDQPSLEHRLDTSVDAVIEVLARDIKPQDLGVRTARLRGTGRPLGLPAAEGLAGELPDFEALG